jgi:CO dehydrogenase maturation factor
MKISISGKGGSGKTTTSGVLARAFAQLGYPVLAIDNDNNPNLGLALGLSPDQVANSPTLPRDLLQEVWDEAAGKKVPRLMQDIDGIAQSYGVTAPGGVKLLAMNRIDTGGKG